MGMVVVMDGDLEREMGGMKVGVMGGGNGWYVGWMMTGSEDGHGYVGRRRYWVQMEVKLCDGDGENETSRRHNKNRAPITGVKWTYTRLISYINHSTQI